MTDLIPLDILFGSPDRASPSLSPDGARLAWLARSGDVLNIHVAPRDAPGAAVRMTHDTVTGVAHYTWCFDNRHILYLLNPSGDENWHVYALNVDTGHSRDLTPWEGAASGVHTLSPDHPNRVLVSSNRREAALHDLIGIDLDSAETETVFENPGFLSLVTDRDLHVRFGLAPLEGGAVRYLQLEGTSWTPFMDVPAEDVLTTRLTGFTRAKNAVYAVDSRGQDVARLISIDLQTGAETVLAAPEGRDVVEVLAHPDTNALLAFTTNTDRRHWHAVDAETARDLERLQAAQPGDLHVVSRSRDLDHWVVAYAQDDGPAQFHLYDRSADTISALFSASPALEAQPLVPVAPVHITARDGLDLISYLALPEGRSPGDSRPALPFILTVHGGPWGRVNWGYDASLQWLANRGFAVLSPNFRGSTGFGKAFLNAGDRQWGAAMQDDLRDCVDWAVTQGVADPARLAIMGASYGGYAVLRALTLEPDRFACGVAMCPPADLVAFLENVPPYWGPLDEVFARKIGDIGTPEGRAMLADRSPMTHLDRLSAPLFLVHGANDVRVSQNDSDAVAAHLQDRGVPYLYALFETEGHVLARPENVRAFHALADQFLSRTIGTRAEPLRDVSSIDGLHLTGPLAPHGD